MEVCDKATWTTPVLKKGAVQGETAGGVFQIPVFSTILS
jgi:hypothetical protein